MAAEPVYALRRLVKQGGQKIRMYYCHVSPPWQPNRGLAKRWATRQQAVTARRLIEAIDKGAKAAKVVRLRQRGAP